MSSEVPDTKPDFHHRDVPISDQISHSNWLNHLVDLCNKENFKILEVGSREVCGKSKMRQLFNKATYIGFDYYPGDNVDIVGDAHRLSSYFNENEKFDLIFSSAVFEHFAAPWVVAKEMTKLLKVGGYIFHETHYSFSSHERPWHFFQFSENALEILFNKAMGIKCINKGCSNLIEGRFSDKLCAPYLQGRFVTGLYCHSEFLGQKVQDVQDFSWDNVDIVQLYNGLQYPIKGKS